MALPRSEVSEGLVHEFRQFEALLRTLSDDQWNTPSRCAGWTVGDVARHNVGSMADVLAGRLDGLGSPEVTQREVDERAGRSAAEVADECAQVAQGAAALLAVFDDNAWSGPAGGTYDGTLGDGVEALWYDAWMHADDIRASLGMAPVVGPGLRGALSHLEPFTRALGWSGAVPGERDPQAYQWVMVATGRAAAATLLGDLGTNPPPAIY